MIKKKYNILIVDDVEENVQVVANILKPFDYSIQFATDGYKALKWLRRRKFDLILLDVMMPGMDGYQVCEEIRKDPVLGETPIIFLTAKTSSDDIVKGFNVGGNDYIKKPFNKNELIARIKTQLKIIEKNELIRDEKKLFELMVNEKTSELKQLTVQLVITLEKANLYNDLDTGLHIKRVCKYSALLAEKYGCTEDFVQKIDLYASLHDIGKIGVSDTLLKKPGRYTEEEYRQMQEHVTIGYQLLIELHLDEMVSNIAMYHHEKWDGTGYSEGLAGEDIPLEARIVALADVYDALTTKRVYKDAFSEEEADKIILENKGKHFDPKLVDIFLDCKDEILKIKGNLHD